MVSFALISILALIITSYCADYSRNTAEREILRNSYTSYSTSGAYMDTYAKDDAPIKRFTMVRIACHLKLQKISKQHNMKRVHIFFYASVGSKIFVFFNLLHIRANCVYVCNSLECHKQKILCCQVFVRRFLMLEEIRISC